MKVLEPLTYISIIDTVPNSPVIGVINWKGNDEYMGSSFRQPVLGTHTWYMSHQWITLWASYSFIMLINLLPYVVKLSRCMLSVFWWTLHLLKL